MKKNKKQDQAFLFEQIEGSIEKSGDLAFDYADIKGQINYLKYEKAPKRKALCRFTPRVLAVACSLVLVTSALGFGGFMMSRRGAGIEPSTTVSGETTLSPESQPPSGLPTLYPDDVLLWQGEVFVRTDLTVDARDVGNQLGQVMSDDGTDSQHSMRDNPQVAIAEHLEDGTPFHRVEDTENYIAVHSEEGYVIYQRQLIPDTTEP